MAAASGTTYIVTPHEGEAYEVSADSMVVDETNTNRVTFYKGEDVVAVENSASSVRPK